MRLSVNQLPSGRWLRSEGYPTSEGGTVSIFSDITEDKETEARLAQLAQEAETSHARLTDAIEAIGQGFVLYDHEDRIVLHNQRIIDMFRSAYGPSDDFKVGARFEDMLRASNNVRRRFESEAEREEWIQRILRSRVEQKVRSST